MAGDDLDDLMLRLGFHKGRREDVSGREVMQEVALCRHDGTVPTIARYQQAM